LLFYISGEKKKSHLLTKNCKVSFSNYSMTKIFDELKFNICPWTSDAS